MVTGIEVMLQLNWKIVLISFLPCLVSANSKLCLSLIIANVTRSIVTIPFFSKNFNLHLGSSILLVISVDDGHDSIGPCHHDRATKPG